MIAIAVAAEMLQVRSRAVAAGRRSRVAHERAGPSQARIPEREARRYSNERARPSDANRSLSEGRRERQGARHEAASGVAGHSQGLPGGGRQRRHRSRGDAGRDSRGARRERRRQVDADEDHLRRHPADRRRDVLGRRRGDAREPRACAHAGDRDGLPALFTVRDADRRRERGAGAAAGARPRRACRGGSSKCRSATDCRWIRAGWCTRCRSASASGSRSSAASCRAPSSSSWTSRRPC